MILGDSRLSPFFLKGIIMKNLASYILSQNEFKFSKLTLLFSLICLVLGFILYSLLSYFITQDDFQNLLNEVPTIEIQKGRVQSPLSTLWEKTLPSGAIVRIDTKENTINSSLSNSIQLTQDKFTLIINGQTQSYDLPQESLTIDKPLLETKFREGILSSSALLALFLFISLWIGFFLCYAFTSLFLSLAHKNFEKPIRYRAAVLGWLSIVFLNIVLTVLGHGLSIAFSVLLAVTISMFSLIYLTRD